MLHFITRKQCVLFGFAIFRLSRNTHSWRFFAIWHLKLTLDLMTHLCWECDIPYCPESKNICEPDTKTQSKKQNRSNRWIPLVISIRVQNSSCLILVQKTLSCRSTCKHKHCLAVFKSCGFNGQINTLPSTCKYCLPCFVKLEMAPWQMAWAHS